MTSPYLDRHILTEREYRLLEALRPLVRAAESGIVTGPVLAAALSKARDAIAEAESV